MKTLGYAYRPDGKLKTHTTAEGVAINYNYDDKGRFQSMALPTGDISVEGFVWSAVTGVNFPNGAKSQFSYDSLLRQVSTTTAGAGGSLAFDKYTYDKVGNIREKITQQGVHKYSYDAQRRLTSITKPNVPTRTLSYDKVGNRTNDSSAGAWRYDDADRLLASHHETFTYDENGHTKTRTNLSDNSQILYAYDARERLTRVAKLTNGSNKVVLQENAYDFAGRRTHKTVNGQTTYFLYGAGGSLLGEYDETGQLIQGYGYAPGASYGSSPLYTFVDNAGQAEYHYYHTDRMGTPQILTDKDGTVSWAASYDEFGMATIQTEKIRNNVRFSGQYFDAEVGLHYNYYRDYDPTLGRYLQRDPIGLAGGINAYGYANQNPLSFVDPYGLAWYNDWMHGNVFSRGFENLFGQDAADEVGRFTHFMVHHANEEIKREWSNERDECGNLTTKAKLVLVAWALTWESPLDGIEATAEGDYSAAAWKAIESIPISKVMKGEKVVNVLKSDVVADAPKQMKKAGKCCFVAGTQVLTEDGYKNIEDVEFGEKLWAKDVETGEADWKPVTKIWREPNRGIYEIKLVNQDGDIQTIEATDDHPFYVVDKGWRTTIELAVNDKIETKETGDVTVIGVTDEKRTDLTYNFTVADFHTYYVTKQNVLVHNCGGRLGKQKRLRELANDDKVSSADRGWIQQEINSIERGNRKRIRNPPGKDLAHERGREAAKGYGYDYSNLQDRKLHRLQHRYDNFGRKNKERPPVD